VTGALRVYRVPHSTNVARVALAAALKGVAIEWVDVDPDDRSELVRISGQPLVPVLVAGGGGGGAEVVTDSPAILRWLEQHFPLPPLLPADPAARAEVEIFCDWFNRVWKRPPNAIDAELGKAAPDEAAIAGWSAELRGALGLFEGLLGGRNFLFGALSLADITAFPFLRYPVLGLPAGDDERFHRILVEHMPLGDGYPGLRAWVARLDALPRA
jgi:glutathione S-transferase